MFATLDGLLAIGRQADELDPQRVARAVAILLERAAK